MTDPYERALAAARSLEPDARARLARELLDVSRTRVPLSTQSLSDILDGDPIDVPLPMPPDRGSALSLRRLSTCGHDDPAAEWAAAWLEDHPDARAADIWEAVEVVYGSDEADRVTMPAFRAGRDEGSGA